MNGDLFGYIDTPDGRRFVKYDKTTESRARRDTAPKPAEPKVKVVYRDRNSDSSNDVRSGRIFERNDKFDFCAIIWGLKNLKLVFLRSLF